MDFPITLCRLAVLLLLVATAAAARPTPAGAAAAPLKQQAAASALPRHVRAASPSVLARVRRFLAEDASKPWKWDPKRDNRGSQAMAYSSQGQDPGGPGDAFTWEFAEASATSNYNGVYYNDGGKAVEAGDMPKGGWAGTYAKNDAGLPTPTGTTSAVAANFQSEYSSQWGKQAISGTFCGTRAVAGSNSFFNAATKEGQGNAAIPWGTQAISTNIDAYGPTPGDRTDVKNKIHARHAKSEDVDRGYFTSRSVAFTDPAPNSAAQAFTGNGPAAISRGWEVSSAARAARDKKAPPVTIGHRAEGNGAFDAMQQQGASRHLLLGCH